MGKYHTQMVKESAYRTLNLKKVRTADDGTIVSYDIDVIGVITTHHRKYMSKVKNAYDETDVSGNTGEENRAGAESQTSSQQ